MTEIFRGISQSLQANIEIQPKFRKQPVHFACFQIRYFMGNTQIERETASLLRP
jgi:hypothetical protein